MPEFVPYPKTPRLFRDVIITEKIDGTNAAVGVGEDGEVWAQSRKRLIEPTKNGDNAGFARWVADNAEPLASILGPGLHFGEWWGSGIQRGYGLEKGEKRFSLFNVDRWADVLDDDITEDALNYFGAPIGLGVVPTLYRGPFRTVAVHEALDKLRLEGSLAAPGFMRPEGVCVFHTASRTVFKALLEGDDVPKSLAS
jgi:hypothetical protein